MKRILFGLLLMLVLSGCFCPKCPPTLVCPTPPKPIDLPPLSLCVNNQSFEKGDPAGKLLQCLEGDLLKALNRITEFDQQLQGYR